MNNELMERLIKNLEELNENLEMFNREVFTAKQAAKYLGIGYSTLLSLTRIGRIEHVPNGASYLYKKEYLDNWLERNKREVI